MEAKHLLPLLAAALLGCSGCASIVRGFRPAGIDVKSDPPGARIFLDGEEVGTTPKTVLPSKRGEHALRLEKSGYQPAETTVVKSVDPWVCGNLLFGGVIGITVDSVDGHWSKCTPREWEASLVPGSDSPASVSESPIPSEGPAPAEAPAQSVAPDPAIDALLEKSLNAI